MKYAVIISGNRQYKVSEGDIIEVDQLAGKVEDTHTFAQVLLYVDGDKSQFGTPLLSHVPVTGSIVSHKKGKKIRVAKFKAKSRYRRVQGFRPAVTLVKITSIGSQEGTKDTASPAKVKSEKKETVQK